jgi:DNA-binding MarR family transcriptional regulator
MRPYPTQRDKTIRALRLYLELLDTAAWLKNWMQRHLVCFDLTMQEFRLLFILHRQGPTPMMKAAEKLGTARSNLNPIAARLQENGWVRLEKASRPPAGNQEPGREGLHIRVLKLTREGKKFVDHFLPKHAKWVKSTMRALDGRQQETLRRLCARLREGDIVKFIEEMRMKGEEEW